MRPGEEGFRKGWKEGWKLGAGHRYEGYESARALEFYVFRRDSIWQSGDHAQVVKQAVHSPCCFGARLRQARERMGLPQDKLGVMIGLDEGSSSARISRYETGVHEPAFNIACKLAQALQVDVAYFYCEDDWLANAVLRLQNLSQAQRSDLDAWLAGIVPAEPCIN